MLLPLARLALHASLDVIRAAIPRAAFEQRFTHARDATATNGETELAIILAAHFELLARTASGEGHDAAVGLALGHLALHIVAILAVDATARAMAHGDTALFVGLHLANHIARDLRLEELLALRNLGQTFGLSPGHSGAHGSAVAATVVALLIHATEHVATTAFDAICFVRHATAVEGGRAALDDARLLHGLRGRSGFGSRGLAALA